MSDSPIQTILQQRDARPVSGEHLELLGKQAARSWTMGKCASLHEAIVETVRGERLSPEQVRRVVEFTNGDAYLQEFRKEGGQHRVVHFDCGPADPAQVLQDLNDGGGGSVYDRGTLDYNLSPSMAKRASAAYQQEGLDKTAAANSDEAGTGREKSANRYEDELFALFVGDGRTSVLPPVEPLQPLADVHTKLAGAHAHVTSEIDRLEIDYAEACNQLYHHVKQAALEGTSLSDVVTVWSAVTTEPVYAKVAFAMFTPRFRRDGVFPSLDAIGASLEKRASVGRVNTEHPLVSAYADFVTTLNKLASLRGLQAELAEGQAQAHELLTKASASGGIIGAAKKGLSAAGRSIDSASPAIAQALVGAEDAHSLAPTLAKGLKATGLLGAGLVGNAALQSITDRPVVQSGLSAVKAVVPGTAEYQNRRYRTMTGQ